MKRIYLLIPIVLALALVIFMLVRDQERETLNSSNSNRSAKTPEIDAGVSREPFWVTSTLDEMGERHLTSKESELLISQVEDMESYSQPSSDGLGDVMCGSSERNDQLVQINKSEKLLFVANGGLNVTKTNNSFDWDQSSLRTFLMDQSVVCGVATTIPRTIIGGSSILWWTTCVGGAGPPGEGDPDYETVVKCLQAEEVLDKYYGWDTSAYVSKNGVSFSFPTNLKLQLEPSTLDAYFNYRFARSDDKNIYKSSILISIPNKARNTNTSIDIAAFMGLTDNTITSQTVLNGHSGQKASYNSRPSEGDVYIPSTTFVELYPGPEGYGPVTIQYYRVDDGVNLSGELEAIKQTLSW